LTEQKTQPSGGVSGGKVFSTRLAKFKIDQCVKWARAAPDALELTGLALAARVLGWELREVSLWYNALGRRTEMLED
jgi:hypothetical protein